MGKPEWNSFSETLEVTIKNMQELKDLLLQISIENIWKLIFETTH